MANQSVTRRVSLLCASDERVVPIVRSAAPWAAAGNPVPPVLPS